MAQTRIRIGKQNEKSVTPGSIIRTDASNEQEYVAPGTAGQVLQIIGGIPTWTTPAGGGALVNNTPVAFVPTSTGNTTNLNEIVTDPNGDVWYIDGNGDAQQVECNFGVKIDTSNLGTISAPTPVGKQEIHSTYGTGFIGDVSGLQDTYYTALHLTNTTTSYTSFPDTSVDVPFGSNSLVKRLAITIKSATPSLSDATAEIYINGTSVASSSVNQSIGSTTIININQSVTSTDIVTVRVFTTDNSAVGSGIDFYLDFIYE